MKLRLSTFSWFKNMIPQEIDFKAFRTMSRAHWAQSDSVSVEIRNAWFFLTWLWIKYYEFHSMKVQVEFDRLMSLESFNYSRTFWEKIWKSRKSGQKIWYSRIISEKFENIKNPAQKFWWSRKFIINLIEKLKKSKIIDSKAMSKTCILNFIFKTVLDDIIKFWQFRSSCISR